ncbi:MAG: diacylglycerol kinase family lipid kinase [Clostridia bacterium]
MADVYIIWNPIAGNGAAVNTYATVSGALDARGIPFIVGKSAYPGHAIVLAKQAIAENCKKIIVLGGDGTVREVATALYGTDVPMGIVPCGTGNDMSRPLGIPTDPLKALEIALNGTPHHMDAAMVNDELFFNVAGFGFDVDVLDYTEIYKKKTKNGSLAYLRGLLRAMTDLKNRETTITWPGGTLQKSTLLIAAGNGTHFGGGMMVTPKADPFDGLLDICVIHDVTKLALLIVLPRFIKGKHLGTKYVTYFRTTELTAVCDPVSRIDVDGEVMPGTPVTFKILPASLWIIRE